MATPTSAKEWKGKATQGEEVRLPSGNVALIRRPGMEKLFSAGVLPDELTKVALEKVNEAKGAPQDFKKKSAISNMDSDMLEKFMQSENAVNDIFMAFDRVTEMCVVQPPVRWHMRRAVDDNGVQLMDDKNRQIFEEIPFSERDEEVLYTDDVDVEDKTFIFNFVVGGTRDLNTFREQYGDAVATVQPREDVPLSTE